jgi:hypothetical protein
MQDYLWHIWLTSGLKLFLTVAEYDSLPDLLIA